MTRGLRAPEAAGGLPGAGLDVAANADDSYQTVLTCPARVCTCMLVTVETKGATISLDGGTTDHLHIGVGMTFLSGLAIPDSSVIQGKNLVATNDYTNLGIAVW